MGKKYNKFKKWIKNNKKGGYIGSFLGFSYLVYQRYSLIHSSSQAQAITTTGVISSTQKSFVQLLIDSITYQFKTTSHNAFPFFSIPPIYGTIFMLLVGFFVGAFIYSKFKKRKIN